MDLVIAAARLMGFSVEQMSSGPPNHDTWYLRPDDNDRKYFSWFLYGAKNEVQGPWIPETAEEWIAALDRIRRELLLNDRLERGPEIFDDVFRREDMYRNDIQ